MRKSFLLVMIAVSAAFSSQARAQFCPGANGWVFDDVPANDLFCGYITWAAQNGITQGCLTIDANHRLYCPNEGVARSQMAAFVNRLATNAAFQNGGNAYASTAVLGTTDNYPLEVRANGSRVMRYEPDATSPNIIGGHVENRAASVNYYGQTIGGGGASGNCTDPTTATVRPCANGTKNSFATVSGGLANLADGFAATVSGGIYNSALNSYSVVMGGYANSADGPEALVGGGRQNKASGNQSVVVGGFYNMATGSQSFAGGGVSNVAGGWFATLGGGLSNAATGFGSMVAGGVDNIASGDYSFAAGRSAATQSEYGPGATVHHGTFIFADHDPHRFFTKGHGEFAARATGGVRFVLSVDDSGVPTWTCSVVAGSSWACSSDRNRKQNLEPLDGRAVLAKVAEMPVYQWNPKGANSHHRHFGPTAQDFYAAFGLGGSDVTIGQQDADGVALAAIQGLNAKIESQAEEIRTLREQYRRDVAELKRAVELLTARTASEIHVAARYDAQ